jgi:hypothetical protein
MLKKQWPRKKTQPALFNIPARPGKCAKLYRDYNNLNSMNCSLHGS